jgi:hypothetical protein
VSGSGRRVAELVEGFQVKVERLAGVPERFGEGCAVGDDVGHADSRSTPAISPAIDRSSSRSGQCKLQ